MKKEKGKLVEKTKAFGDFMLNNGGKIIGVLGTVVILSVLRHEKKNTNVIYATDSPEVMTQKIIKQLKEEYPED